MVITGGNRRAKVSPEWTKFDHAQPGHLRTMTKLIQLWTVDANRVVAGILPMTPACKTWVNLCSSHWEADFTTHRADAPEPPPPMGPLLKALSSPPMQGPSPHSRSPTHHHQVTSLHVMQYGATRKGLHKSATELEQTRITLSFSELHKLANRTSKDKNPSVPVTKGLPLQR